MAWQHPDNTHGVNSAPNILQCNTGIEAGDKWNTKTSLNCSTKVRWRLHIIPIYVFKTIFKEACPCIISFSCLHFSFMDEWCMNICFYGKRATGIIFPSWTWASLFLSVRGERAPFKMSAGWGKAHNVEPRIKARPEPISKKKPLTCYYFSRGSWDIVWRMTHVLQWTTDEDWFCRI